MSDFRETLVNITKNAGKTTTDLFKTAKLNISLTNEQTTIKNLYTEIGKKVHEIYQYGGSLGKYFDEKYLELEAAERKMAEIREQISIVKGVRECLKCGKSVERSAEFCPKCGIRLEGNAPAIPEPTHEGNAPLPESAPMDFAPPPPPLPPPSPGRNCRVCGAANDATTKFCLSCGRLVD
ncbi:MAG: zinc ribbon domain-containing protein [Defluviitaleaceae bacterium]|nr:zinc ribbon domain-containing protein [Defluviitaleaceae bacterium]MCL2238677.1 zinc ribbon domain-containing protein [Defluviitaleaceae bacterium]